MMNNIELRTLMRDGKCICCGEGIVHNEKEVFVIAPFLSHVYQVTICQDCIAKLYWRSRPYPETSDKDDKCK